MNITVVVGLSRDAADQLENNSALAEQVAKEPTKYPGYIVKSFSNAAIAKAYTQGIDDGAGYDQPCCVTLHGYKIN